MNDTTNTNAVWISTATSNALRIASGLVAALTLVVEVVLPLVNGDDVFPNGAVGIVGFVAAAVVYLFSRITVMADHRGVTVLYSMLRVPRTTVALADIDTVEPAEINPLHWGGWGYRMRSPKKAAVVLRKGDGMVITKRNGRTLAITVDNPADGIQLLNELAGRAPIAG